MFRKSIKYMICLASVAALWSCGKELSPEVEDTKAGDPVTIAVAEDNGYGSMVETKGIGINRGHQLDASSYVINGEFAAYVGSSTMMTSHQRHCVLFENNTTAHLFKVTNFDTGEYSLDQVLEWDKFRKADKTYEAIQFWMDNLPLTKQYYWGVVQSSVPAGWGGTAIPFTEEEKYSFRAQYEEYDASGNPIHTNDIISSASSSYQTFNPKSGSVKQDQIYEVSLRHKMSRFSIELVDVPENYEIQEIVITNLVQNINEYRRWDGGVVCNYSGSNDGRSDWTFSSKHIHKSENPTSIVEGKNCYTYTTTPVILPAHAFTYNNKEYWPVLKVKFIDSNNPGYTYNVKGVIPRSYYQNYTSTGGGTAAALTGFSVNRHLTIPAKLSTAMPDIIFMPVREVDWVDIGHYIIDGAEPEGGQGIHTLDELKFCIDYFNKAPLFPAKDKATYYWGSNTAVTYSDMRAYWNLLTLFGASYEVNSSSGVRTSVNFKFADDFETNVTQPQIDALVAAHNVFKGSLTQDTFTHNVPDFSDPAYIQEYTYNTSVKLTFTGSDGKAAYTSLNISGLKGSAGIYTYEDLERMIFEINNRGDTSHNFAYNSYLWRFGTLETKGSTVKSGVTYYDVVYHVNLYADLPAPSVKIRIPERLYVNTSDVTFYRLNDFKIDLNFNGHTIEGVSKVDDLIQK